LSSKKAKYTALAVVFFSIAFFPGMMGQTTDIISKDYGISLATSSTLISMMNVGSFVCAFLSIFFLGNANTVHVLWYSMVVWTAILLFLTLYPPLFVLFISFALAGAGFSLANLLTNAVCVDITGKEKHGIVIRMHSLFSIGGICAPYLARYIKSISSGRMIFVSLASIIAVMAIVYGAAFRKKSREKIRSEMIFAISGRPTVKEALEIFKNPDIIRLCIYTMGFALLQVSAVFYSAIYLKSMTENTVLIASGAGGYFLGLFIGRMVTPKLIKFKNINIRTYLTTSSLLMGVFFISSLLIQNALVVCIFILLASACNASALPMSITLGCDIAQARSKDISGLVISSNSFGMIIGPLIIGFIGHKYSLWWGLCSISILMLASVFAVCGFKSKVN
jgi:predicted MFS family arabinose efflux permease